MNQDMKVSILVPFFKVEQYVGRCVESLFTQTYKNIEYIFVNDCSPDKSMEVINSMIDKYDMASKCKIIVHENNLGISASRNDCLDNMTGDYFLFIDSDDYIDKDMVDDYLFCCQIIYYAQRFAGVDRCMYHWIQYNPNNYTHTTIFAVESQAAAIRKTEDFYREKGVYEVVSDSLLRRKFVSKLPLLLERSCRDVRRWRSLFPESNGVWQEMHFSKRNRLLFRIANSPFFVLIPIVCYFR